MIDLRYVIDKETGERRLHFRCIIGYMDASGAWNVARAEWSEWKQVPEITLSESREIPDAEGGDGR